MPSSRPEATADLHGLLDEVGSLYDRAFGALEQGELDRVLDLVARAELIVQQMPSSDTRVDAALATRRDEVLRRHHRLVAAARTTQNAIREELTTVREGKRSLKAYGGRSDPLGGRVDRDA